MGVHFPFQATAPREHPGGPAPISYGTIRTKGKGTTCPAVGVWIMRRKHPELYEELKQFYQQDPAKLIER